MAPLSNACVALFPVCALFFTGCAAMENVAEPPVTGDPPSTNAATTSRKDVPFCPGGDRAKACVFGQNCRITEQGCQVCQCHTMQ